MANPSSFYYESESQFEKAEMERDSYWENNYYGDDPEEEEECDEE